MNLVKEDHTIEIRTFYHKDCDGMIIERFLSNIKQDDIIDISYGNGSCTVVYQVEK